MVDVKRITELAQDPDNVHQAIFLYQKQSGSSVELAEEVVMSFLRSGSWPNENQTSQRPQNNAKATLYFLEHPIQEVEELLEEGNQDAAVQRYQELIGGSTEEALTAIQHYGATGRWADVSGVESQTEDKLDSTSITAKDPLDQVRQSLQDGDEQVAIRKYQKYTGHSIEDAQEAINFFRKKGVWLSQSDLKKISLHEPQPIEDIPLSAKIETPAALPVERPMSRNRLYGVIVLVVVLLAVAFWMMF